MAATEARTPQHTSEDPIAEALLSAIEEVSDGKVARWAREVDRERAFPRRSIEALADCGALALLVPRRDGGVEAGLQELQAVCERVGRACASTGMVYLMHCVASAAIAHGGGVRASKYLRALACGEKLGTLAFSERATGAHFYAPELRAERRDGTVRISGRKSFVTSGGHADLYLVLTQSPGGEGFDCYAVEAKAPGLSFEGAWEGLGMAGNSSITMVLDDVTVEEDARIGPAGGAGELVFAVVAPAFLIGLSGVNVGIAAAASATAAVHAAGRRYADGSTLAAVQAVQHALADMEVSLRCARAGAHEAAARADAGADDAMVAAMSSKVAATETAEEVTQRALDVCGGQGYTPVLPVERHLRDARAGRVMAPTNAVLRSWIGKAVAGLPVP